MSIEAINTYLRLPVKPSSHKFVLLVYANFANEDMESYPSIQVISEITSLNRKTIILAIRDLIKKGLIKDTGRRKGTTSQIPIYQLLEVEEYQKRNSSKNGTVPKTEQFQNFHETVPIFPDNSTNFGTRIPQDTEEDTEDSNANALLRRAVKQPTALRWPDDDLWLLEYLKGQKMLTAIPLPLDHKWWDRVTVVCNGVSERWLDKQFALMEAWLDENRSRKPTTDRGIKRFIRGWLQRTYEKERVRGG